MLYQNSQVALDCDLAKPQELVEILQLFFEYRQPYHLVWEDAVQNFSNRIPELATGVTNILETEHKKNPDFRSKFAAFADLCRSSINPDLADPAIRKMLVQHLLTERIFRKVFSNQEFLSRNVIAIEIEKVIRSITARHFSRDEFLKNLDHFYVAIERAAEAQTGYAEKQQFLNTVYEKFFQSFDKKQADTHGIVYTPQPIVDFMVRSVEEVLHSEFGKSLSDPGVHILDPFTGTGTFITRIIQQIKRSSLLQKYAEDLHCNEVMLLPYYIASMNIEHAYMEQMGEYRSFEGICLVDTFELAEPQTMQLEFMNEGNSERVRRQKKAPIRVVIGNPPYNMGQVNENDRNKNRKYKHMDKRVKETYTKDSKATLRNKLSDPYVKAFRLASDRIRTTGGVIAYVTNNSFIDQLAFDGMRRHLAHNFSKIFTIDLGGNVRQNPKLSGSTHNVFGIQVGVAITILVKHVDEQGEKDKEIFYARMPTLWRRGEKTAQLDRWKSVGGINWEQLAPDKSGTWLTRGQQDDYTFLLPLGVKSTKGLEHSFSVFRSFTLGVVSAREAYVYNFSRDTLKSSMKTCVKAYNESLAAYKHVSKPRPAISDFVDIDDLRIKWSRQTKRLLSKLEPSSFNPSRIRNSLYRPFTVQLHYFEDFWNEELYKLRSTLPTLQSESENRLICATGPGYRSSWSVIASKLIPTYTVCSSTDAFQCFPFYTYDEDGTNRQENITDWALAQYKTHYTDPSITKWNIFHSTYALLHHPEYRTRYAANLKRELPRIPFPPDLHAFAAAGKRLMELHIDYKQQPEYKLEEVDNREVPFTLRVERMRLNKDKTELRYNEAFTLRGIPPEAFTYRLEPVLNFTRVFSPGCGA